eukprot:GHVP01059111.1.p1 GENE.GHVP01059111.1~~GHVP01059111.1.p1  ORF type:complete len:642 (-),score=123.75 GHVP01059111.1:72-1997(-)
MSGGLAPSIIKILKPNLGLCDDSVIPILKALEQKISQSVHTGDVEVHLDLSANKLTSKAVVSICNWFSSRSDLKAKLTLLKLFKNQIDDVGAKAIANLVWNQKSPLEEIHLSHNRISAAGLQVLLHKLLNAPDTRGNPLYPRYDRNKNTYLPIWIRLEYNSIMNVQQVLDQFQRSCGRRMRLGKNVCCFATRGPHSVGSNNKDPHCSPAKCLQSSIRDAPLVHLYSVHNQAVEASPSPSSPKRYHEPLRSQKNMERPKPQTFCQSSSPKRANKPGYLPQTSKFVPVGSRPEATEQSTGGSREANKKVPSEPPVSTQPFQTKTKEEPEENIHTSQLFVFLDSSSILKMTEFFGDHQKIQFCSFPFLYALLRKNLICVEEDLRITFAIPFDARKEIDTLIRNSFERCKYDEALRDFVAPLIEANVVVYVEEMDIDPNLNPLTQAQIQAADQAGISLLTRKTIELALLWEKEVPTKFKEKRLSGKSFSTCIASANPRVVRFVNKILPKPDVSNVCCISLGAISSAIENYIPSAAKISTDEKMFQKLEWDPKESKLCANTLHDSIQQVQLGINEQQISAPVSVKEKKNPEKKESKTPSPKSPKRTDIEPWAFKKCLSEVRQMLVDGCSYESILDRISVIEAESEL